MMKYVVGEVERVKQLFEGREARLAADRDAARREAASAAEQAAATAAKLGETEVLLVAASAEAEVHGPA